MKQKRKKKIDFPVLALQKTKEAMEEAMEEVKEIGKVNNEDLKQPFVKAVDAKVWVILFRKVSAKLELNLEWIFDRLRLDMSIEDVEALIAKDLEKKFKVNMKFFGKPF